MAPDVAGEDVQASDGAHEALWRVYQTSLAADVVRQQASTVCGETLAAIRRAQAFRKRLDAAERRV